MASRRRGPVGLGLWCVASGPDSDSRPDPHRPVVTPVVTCVGAVSVFYGAGRAYRYVPALDKDLTRASGNRKALV